MTNIKEGDFCKAVEVGGHTIKVYYGYNEPELERGRIDLMPIYPNFIERPLYTTYGYAIVRADQDICKHFSPKPKASNEGWCNDCELFDKCEEFIGICKCPHNGVHKNE